MVRTGRCLCDKTRYRITGRLGATVLCHCTDCQRQTGSATSVTVDVAMTDLHVESTEHLRCIVTIGELHRTNTSRFFCGNCGSPIYSQIEAYPGVVYIKAGTLDDTSDLNPTVELWCRSAQGWVPPVPGAERHNTEPPAEEG